VISPDFNASLPLFLTILTPNLHIETDLEQIAQLADQREEDNDYFQSFLASQDAASIDARVFALQADITPKIDCRQCGNCCKTLMIEVTQPEADRVAEVLGEESDQFVAENLEKGIGQRMIMNAIPCRFLEELSCTIYADRFAGCREFPALHLPGFTARYFTTRMHYGRCPIIFNVLEALKKELFFFTPDLPVSA
jgi:Fe-S-cluster containining protein